MRLDIDVAGEGRLAYIRRFPRGVVVAISPLNFALNLADHKVAPSIAVGAPVILEPAPRRPCPACSWASSWPTLAACRGSERDQRPRRADARGGHDVDGRRRLVADPRLPVVSFTGSERVGHVIQQAVPAMHVTLELGGNAAVVVGGDLVDQADLDFDAERIATFANYPAGQSCIGAQRVYVDDSL